MRLALDHTREEAPDVISFFFRPEASLSWRAGQYLHYTLPHSDPDARKDDRFFTIAAAPHERMAMITTRLTEEHGSSFKKALRLMRPGDVIEADGPHGTFVLDDPGRPSVFIAGGIGVTPFRSILLDLDHRGSPLNITLLYANRTEDAVYKSELTALAARHPEFKILYFVGDKRIDAAAIKASAPDLQTPPFFISGPEPMVKAFENMLTEMGVPTAHQKRDYFPGYGAI